MRPTDPTPTTDTAPAPSLAATEQHAASLLATAVADAGPSSARPGPSATPERLGRYRVLHELGRGGMGAVFLAYDPELDRKVAVKLLATPDGDAAHQDRLLREAQAMARLAHPNVAAVFDVGVLAGQVYLAMEYVEGASLRVWLATPRPWRAIVATFIEAGRGLAAAHAAGLVHRDFKPENAIVGADGRLRVLDFGLATLHDNLSSGPGLATPLAPTTSLSLPGLASRSLLASRLTHAGAVVGTLLYMSPEQVTLGELDARSDQFSFCVALWEALHGQLPFAGDSAHAYALALTGGDIRVPANTTVPRWLTRVLLRGLAVAREDRWPDMAALLAALARDPAATRRRLALAALGLGGALALGLAVGRRGDAPTCDGAAAPIAAAWDAETRARLEHAVTATAVPYAADALAAVLPRLDAWAARWADVSRTACTAHRDGAASDALFDRQITCLSGQVRDLSARVRLLAAADATAVANAVAAAETLPDPARCRDPAAPGRPARDPAFAERMRELDAEFDLGHHTRAHELAVAVVADAHTPEDLADALFAEGRALDELGRPRESRAVFLRVLARAAAVGAHETAFDSTTWLLAIAVMEFRDLEAAEQWQAVALEFAAAGDLDPDSTERALPMLQAAFASARGDHAAAIALLDRADAWETAEHGPDTLARARIFVRRASILRTAGDLAGAEAAYVRARAILDPVLGLHHPDQAELANNLGVLYSDLQRPDEAIAELRRAHAIVTANEGPDSLHLVYILSNLPAPYADLGRHDEAIAAASQAVDGMIRAIGRNSTRTATAYNNLGSAYLEADRCRDAMTPLTDSLRLHESLRGPDSEELTTVLNNLAYCSLDNGDFVAAESYAARAIANQVRVDPEYYYVPRYRLLRGRALHALGRHEEAVAELERVINDWNDRIPPPDRRGEARFVLAQALWAGKIDRARARDEARTARDVIAGMPSPLFTLAEVDAWLAAH